MDDELPLIEYHRRGRRHRGCRGRRSMPYELTSAHLRLMFEIANFEIPADDMVFVGLRGTSPVDISGTGFAGSHMVQDKGTDYLHMRCSLVQWRPAADQLAIYPGSTVPYLTDVQERVRHGGTRVNQLATCYLRRIGNQDHRYFERDHGYDHPAGPHRAFANVSLLPVWRTGDDADYEGDDRLERATAFDNIHCARQANLSAPSYSSLGCQVVAGVPGRPIARAGGEAGPWKKFVDVAYNSPQSHYCYALFEEGEAQRTSLLEPGQRPRNVRFGSSGPLAMRLQQGLIDAGYSLGPAGADGEFGFLSTDALRAFQRQTFGKDGADLIGGGMTAERLNLAWP
jgi:hypothetical protein